MARAEELVKGIIKEPAFIEKLVEMTNEDKLIWRQMWSALVHNLAHETTTSSVFWMEKFSNDTIFNQILKHLSDSGWVYSDVTGNFATLSIIKEKMYEWVDADIMNDILTNKKIIHYENILPEATRNDLVQINHKWETTGLVREGFRKAGNFKFTYDIETLKKFKTDTIKEAIKSLADSDKQILPYDQAVQYLIEEEIYDPKSHSLGPNISDSRGRSIFQCTKHVFNVVSDKRARSLIVTPFNEPLTKEGRESVYEAISELVGIRGKNHEDKVHHGMNMWITHNIPEDLDLDQKIWLSRLYENLDSGKDFNIPVEFDATASMLQITAVLTNNWDLMDYTNLINPKEFKDAWTIKGLSRLKVKKAATPHLYGSNAEPATLWTQHKMEYVQEEVNIITKEIREGRFQKANEFKNFIIDNVNPLPKMKVRIFNEEFEIHCNRFKPERLSEKVYWVYSSKTNHLEKVVNHIEQEPDLEAFHRYFQTLLLHNLDSQIANYICDNLRFVIPNHDAWVLHPNDVAILRKLYTEALYNIYVNRHTILANYFHSIGIKEWNKNMDVNKEEISHFEPWCLK